MSNKQGAHRKDLHSIISDRQRRYTETVIAMGGSKGTDVKPVVVSVSQTQAVCKQNEKFVIKRLKVKMANCFDFRHRATSFDLHHIGQGAKMSLLSKLFRSKSDTNVKTARDSPRESPSASPRTSPRGSPGAPPKRRFMRVVRDDNAAGEEYVNPHVVRKYNYGFWEKQHMLKKSHSLEERDRPLPYTVTGHTILKKHNSMDENQPTSSSPPGEKKHAKFKEVVEVVEYCPKTRCKLILEDSCILREKLHDEWEECLDVEFQVPREECENSHDDEESCKAILDLVLDTVSRSAPLDSISEDDYNGTEEDPTLSDCSTPTDEAAKSDLAQAKCTECQSTQSSAERTEIQMDEEVSSDKSRDGEVHTPERQCSSDSDIIVAKKSKLEESSKSAQTP